MGRARRILGFRGCGRAGSATFPGHAGHVGAGDGADAAFTGDEAGGRGERGGPGAVLGLHRVPEGGFEGEDFFVGGVGGVGRGVLPECGCDGKGWEGGGVPGARCRE